MQVVALCSKHHTEVSLVADYCSSLSFWQAASLSLLPFSYSPSVAVIYHTLLQHTQKHHSRSAVTRGKDDVLTVLCAYRSLLTSLDGPLQQPAELPTETYDHSKTYIAIIASDGDNMQV